MGAEGVMMGTAFMATKECPLKDAVKEAMVKAGPDNPQLRQRVLAVADPKDLEEVMKLRDKMPLNEWLPMLERVNIKDPDWRNPASHRSEETLEAGLRMVSLAVGVIDSIPTAKELVDSIIREAEEILDSWQFLKTR